MWHPVLKILEVKHLNSFGKIIYQENNIRNILHQEGEEFLLRAAFTGGTVSDIIPENYFLGLDNRSVVVIEQTLDDLIGEPDNGGGYARQEVSSSGDFVINFEDDHFVALSPIVAFSCTSTAWGPVSNLFITDTGDNSGYLISTATFDSPISLTPGESVTMRIGMQLRDCPDST